MQLLYLNFCHLLYPDNLQLTILNSTAISVEWNRTSIFHQDVEISYTLVIRNETDDFHLGEEVFNVSANFNSYPMFYVYNSDSHISSGCHNISFIIFASNSFGESERPARAVTGFPRGQFLRSHNYSQIIGSWCAIVIQ